jgi:hypothetical protein
VLIHIYYKKTYSEESPCCLIATCFFPFFFHPFFSSFSCFDPLVALYYWPATTVSPPSPVEATTQYCAGDACSTTKMGRTPMILLFDYSTMSRDTAGSRDDDDDDDSGWPPHPSSFMVFVSRSQQTDCFPCRSVFWV